jgi:hypothetical protein
MTIHHESPIGAVYFGTAEVREQFGAAWIGSRQPVQRPVVITEVYDADGPVCDGLRVCED